MRMAPDYRWDPCIAHRDSEVDGFLAHYFAQPDRNVFFVGLSGFPNAILGPFGVFRG